MFAVRHQLKICSTTYTSDNKAHLLNLEFKASLDVPVNLFSVILGAPEEITVAVDSPVSIELGYDKKLGLVFTGIVNQVEWSIDRVTIIASGEFQALTTAYFNLFYEKSNAGDIVKNIAQSRLNLKTAKIENGLTFPTYTIGDQQSAYDHLAHLAHQCNVDLYADTDDKLVFAKYNPTTTHTLTYGNNILNYHQAQPAPNITAVEVYGESPASQGQGDQAYSWLTKKDVKGTAGGGIGTKLRIADPTARTQAVANKVAQALLAQKQQKQRGQVRVLGDPNIKLGDAIKIENMPQPEHNGTFKITGVAHHLSRRKGFYTTIDWEQI